MYFVQENGIYRAIRPGIHSNPSSKSIGARKSGLYKINRGGGDDSYWPDEASFAEIWRFDMASGNLVSEIGGDTWTRGGAMPTYNAGGPTGTDLDSVNHGNASDTAGTYWSSSSYISSLWPGTNDFTIIMVMKHDKDQNRLFIDAYTYADTYRGIYINKIGTNFTMQVLDDTGTAHRTDWTDANGATAIEDGNWHHIRMVFDKSATKVELYLDGVAQTTTKISAGNLSDLGTITGTGSVFWDIGVQTVTGSVRALDFISYIAIAHNKTATTPLLP